MLVARRADNRSRSIKLGEEEEDRESEWRFFGVYWPIQESLGGEALGESLIVVPTSE